LIVFCAHRQKASQDPSSNLSSSRRPACLADFAAMDQPGAPPPSPRASALEQGLDEGSQQLFRAVLANLQREQQAQPASAASPDSPAPQSQQSPPDFEEPRREPGLPAIPEDGVPSPSPIEAGMGVPLAGTTARPDTATVSLTTLMSLVESSNDGDGDGEGEGEGGSGGGGYDVDVDTAGLAAVERQADAATCRDVSPRQEQQTQQEQPQPQPQPQEHQQPQEPQQTSQQQDDDDEVERLYERLQQSVHLRAGFRLYRKLCAEEQIECARSVVAAAAAAVDVPSPPTSPSSPNAHAAREPPPPEINPEEVRRSNAERFAARMRRKRTHTTIARAAVASFELDVPVPLIRLRFVVAL
jgi:hypothetical protein